MNGKHNINYKKGARQMRERLEADGYEVFIETRRRINGNTMFLPVKKWKGEHVIGMTTAEVSKGDEKIIVRAYCCELDEFDKEKGKFKALIKIYRYMKEKAKVDRHIEGLLSQKHERNDLTEAQKGENDWIDNLVGRQNKHMENIHPTRNIDDILHLTTEERNTLLRE